MRFSADGNLLCREEGRGGFYQLRKLSPQRDIEAGNFSFKTRCQFHEQGIVSGMAGRNGFGERASPEFPDIYRFHW